MKDSKFSGFVVAQGVSDSGIGWVLGVLDSGDKIIVGRTQQEAQQRIGCTFRYQPLKGKSDKFEVLGYLLN